MDYLHEGQLHEKGFSILVGVDEVGRGAWAGPIVAGAVVLGPDFILKDWPCEIKNSKALSLKKREILYDFIRSKARACAVGIVDNKELDEIGLQHANFLCIERAIAGLGKSVDYVLADYVGGMNLVYDFESLKKGDERVLSIACASIIAKVWRDRHMNELSTVYPQYGFERHVGYGTKLHKDALQAHGYSAIHRRSFNI